tara:strand:+ start:40 stop:504 length:465 start_codon:yes stop_codon:yes gene_type:complete
LDKLLGVNGNKTVDEFHMELGLLAWDKIGMSRNEQGLKDVISKIGELRNEFWQNVKVPGEKNYKNSELEKAGRVADFLEMAEMMANDALTRNESCGGHFREEFQTPENEALRDDKNYCHVSAWEYGGNSEKPSFTLHKKKLDFEFVELKTRSYK